MSATEFGDLFSTTSALARSLASQNATIAMFESRTLSSAVNAARGFDIPKLFGNPTMSALVEFEQRQKLEWCEQATALRNATSGFGVADDTLRQLTKSVRGSLFDIGKQFDQNSAITSLKTALTELDPLTQQRRACDGISGLHVDAPQRTTSLTWSSPSTPQRQDINALNDRVQAKLTSTPTLIQSESCTSIQDDCETAPIEETQDNNVIQGPWVIRSSRTLSPSCAHIPVTGIAAIGNVEIAASLRSKALASCVSLSGFGKHLDGRRVLSVQPCGSQFKFAIEVNGDIMWVICSRERVGVTLQVNLVLCGQLSNVPSG